MQEVEAKFEKFGPVKEARIVRNPQNGESRGFGFVAMKYEEDVDAVSISNLIRVACCRWALQVIHSFERFFSVLMMRAGHQGPGWRRVAGQAPGR